jgi:hypothetical protein
MGLYSGKDHDSDLHFYLCYELHDLPHTSFDVKHCTEYPTYQTMENTDGSLFVVRNAWCQFMVSYTDDTAWLISITKRIPSSQIENTKDLVRITVQDAIQRGMKKIIVEDNISVCREDRYRYGCFALSEYYFMLYGKSWYETIYPFTFLGLTQYLSRNKEVIQEVTWFDIICKDYKFRKETHRKMLNELPIDISKIDINAPGSVMTVLQNISLIEHYDYIREYLQLLMLTAEIPCMSCNAWELILI